MKTYKNDNVLAKWSLSSGADIAQLTNGVNDIRFVYILIFLIALFLFPNMVRLSWNSLAGLHSGPEMQCKHTLAALILLDFVKWMVPHGIMCAGRIRADQYKHA